VHSQLRLLLLLLLSTLNPRCPSAPMGLLLAISLMIS
jgi:hypothetical protein